MNGKEEFARIMNEKGYNRNVLSMYLDETPQNLNQQMSNKVVDLKTERFTELLACMGIGVTYASIPYKKASHRYIENVRTGVADQTYRSEAEKAHRNSLFYAIDEGYEILDNRGEEPLYFAVQSEKEMFYQLGMLCGKEA